MKTLYKDLQEAGLKEKEAKVYMAILELGEANIAQISQRSAINRSTVYLAIKTLKEKDLLQTVKKKKTLFYAEDPRKMLGDLERKKEILEKVMPNLLASFAFIDKKPEVKFFEGDEGIKDLYEDLLNIPNHEMLAWYNNAYLKYFDENYIKGYFVPKRVQNKIWSRAIYRDNPLMRQVAENNEAELRQTRFIDNDKFQIESTICLYGGKKINIVSYKDKMGVIITSQSIYNTLKSIFEVMWDSASK